MVVSAEQRAIYNIVLQTQLVVIENIKPGMLESIAGNSDKNNYARLV
jgi:Xaa-Pro aminopeptidase